jgi:hypothetical protein
VMKTRGAEQSIGLLAGWPEWKRRKKGGAPVPGVASSQWSCGCSTAVYGARQTNASAWSRWCAGAVMPPSPRLRALPTSVSQRQHRMEQDTTGTSISHIIHTHCHSICLCVLHVVSWSLVGWSVAKKLRSGGKLQGQGEGHSLVARQREAGGEARMGGRCGRGVGIDAHVPTETRRRRGGASGELRSPCTALRLHCSARRTWRERKEQQPVVWL